MGRGRKHSKKKIHGKDNKEAYVSSNLSVPARNMRKTDLGAVILGCTNSTIDECLSNKLFGLPALHYSYIKNITEGLPLFLFNYSDRILHGIFEAASHGQMNIDKFAWVGDGDDYTSYPAQVRVRVRQQCHPLSEKLVLIMKRKPRKWGARRIPLYDQGFHMLLLSAETILQAHLSLHQMHQI